MPIMSGYEFWAQVMELCDLQYQRDLQYQAEYGPEYGL